MKNIDTNDFNAALIYLYVIISNAMVFPFLYTSRNFLFRIIFSIIEKESEVKGKNIVLERGYVNLYPHGIGGDWHVDSGYSNSRTILFYPSDWKKEYGGATEFQETGEKVEYKKNRLMMFDGTRPHRSAVHQNPQNRYTIAYKTNIGHK